MSAPPGRGSSTTHEIPLVPDNNHTKGEAPERKQHGDDDEQHSWPERSFGGSIDGVVDPAQREGSEQEQKRD